MLGDPSAWNSSHQEEEDVGSVNTMCIQVVIIVVHTVSSVSTHMCYTVYCCDMLSTPHINKMAKETRSVVIEEERRGNGGS